MPRVIKRVARKDYPKDGIAKGDEYFFTKIKLQRGGLIKRSKTMFKPSELTLSPFKSSFLAVGEEWEAGDKDAEAIRAAGSAIRDLGEEAQGSFDNMPQGLQSGDTGQQLENRASECNRIADELDSLADEMEGLDVPDEDGPEEPIEPLGDLDSDEENEAAQTAYEEAQTAYDEWETAKSEYDSEVERITEEADGLIGEMPE